MPRIKPDSKDRSLKVHQAKAPFEPFATLVVTERLRELTRKPATILKIMAVHNRYDEVNQKRAVLKSRVDVARLLSPSDSAFHNTLVDVTNATAWYLREAEELLCMVESILNVGEND